MYWNCALFLGPPDACKVNRFDARPQTLAEGAHYRRQTQITLRQMIATPVLVALVELGSPVWLQQRANQFSWALNVNLTGRRFESGKD